MAHCLEDDQKSSRDGNEMFSDDPQMTVIMRHLKGFSGVADTAAVSVTNQRSNFIPRFVSQPTIGCGFFLVSEMSFAAMSFFSLPLFDPSTSNHYSPLQTERHSLFATPPLLISASRLRLSKSGTSDMLATYSCVSLQLPVTSIHPLTLEYCTH